MPEESCAHQSPGSRLQAGACPHSASFEPTLARALRQAEDQLPLILAYCDAVSACYRSLGLSWADVAKMAADMTARARATEKVIQQAGMTTGPAEGMDGPHST